MSAGPSTLSSNQPPSNLEYGGDEISALVLDPGQCWTRTGFAGEDTPKTVTPSHYGLVHGTDDDDDGARKLYFGDNDVHAVRAGMEILNPMSDGIVADWDMAPALWRHALTSRLTADLSEHPLLVTEPVWNPPRNREKTIEVAFEDLDVPAFYLAKAAVCAGFAFGKSSALVIDAGAANISVTPIHDGFVLRKGAMRSPLGGDFLSAQIRAHLASLGVPLTAHYQVVSKMPVEVGKPAEATLHAFPPDREPTASFRAFQEERVLTEFKECVAQVWAGPRPLPPPSAIAPAPDGVGSRTFEFPDGYNLVFGSDRFRIAEAMFVPRAMLPLPPVATPPAAAAAATAPAAQAAASGSTASSAGGGGGAATPASSSGVVAPAVPDPETTMGIPQLIAWAMRDIDVEIKQHMLNNVIVTGSTSLLYGFCERLNSELTTQFPGPRVRVHAAGTSSVERRYASWLGGSILASLGSFHQLWVSKREYEEHGANIVEKRCK